MVRSCDGCTKCCEGYVKGEVRGIPLYRGKPCHFLKEACTIYEERPKMCKEFNCVWINDKERIFPEWLHPKISHALVVRREYAKNKDFLQIYEAGKTLDVKILSWFVGYALRDSVPIAYQIEGEWNYIGPKEFVEYFETKHKL